MKYKESPSNSALKAVTLAAAPYLFTKKGQALGVEMLSALPYNCEVYQWSEEHFDHTYQVKMGPSGDSHTNPEWRKGSRYTAKALY